MSLPISALKDETKAFEESIEVATLTHEDKEYVIEFYPLFKYDKIRKLVLELGQFFINANQEKVKIDPLEEDAIINYFIIKHFSKGLKFTSGKKAKTIYDEFKVFYNSSLYQVFKDEVFTTEIVEKSKEEVYKEIFDNIELSAKFEQRLKETQEMIQHLPLENKDIIFGNKEKQIPEV